MAPISVRCGRGSFSAVQAGANAQLRKSLDQPLLAALCVYGSALIALLIALPFTRLSGIAQSKVAEVPWWAWVGGLLSIMSTMGGLMLAEKMGSMFFTATTVTCRDWELSVRSGPAATCRTRGLTRQCGSGTCRQSSGLRREPAPEALGLQVRVESLSKFLVSGRVADEA
jgi:hypothetical protein